MITEAIVESPIEESSEASIYSFQMENVSAECLYDRAVAAYSLDDSDMEAGLAELKNNHPIDNDISSTIQLEVLEDGDLP